MMNSNDLFFLLVSIISFILLLLMIKGYISVKLNEKRLNNFIYRKDGSFNPEARVFLKEVYCRKSPGKRGLEKKLVINYDIYNKAINNMCENYHSGAVTVNNLSSIIIVGC